MPVYEFVCNGCGAPVSVFVRSINAEVNGACGKCGSTDLRRLVSRVTVMRSAGSIDEMNFDENDPRAMARMMREMQGEMGEDAGPEFEEMVSRMERGNMPSEDDLGGLDDFGDDGDF